MTDAPHAAATPPDGPLTLKKLLFLVGKAGLWLVYVLVLFQIGGVIYFKMPYAKPIGSYGYPHDLFTPRGGGMDYGFKPGYHGAFSGGAFHDVTIDINQTGYRDREFGPKKAGVTRIAVLGDSVVFGAGSPKEERLTERLEALLNTAGKPAEVFNFGVNSYGFSNYVGVMGSPEFKALAPDVIVIGFVVNDLEPSGWPKDLSPAGPNGYEQLTYQLYNMAASRLFVQLRDYVHYFIMTADENEQYHTKYMRELLKEFHQTELLGGFDRDRGVAEARAKDLGAKLVVVLLPEINVLRDPAEFGIARDLPRQRFEADNVAVCDLYQDFAVASKNLEALYLPHDDMHLSKRGHQLAADGMARCLSR